MPTRMGHSGLFVNLPVCVSFDGVKRYPSLVADLSRDNLFKEVTERISRNLQRSSFPRLVLLMLAGFAVLNLFRPVRIDYSPDRPVDFRPLYVGQLLLREGASPYDDALIKARWQELAASEGFQTSSLPGRPATPLLYPPWALSIFLPLGWLSYSAAYPVWYAICVVSLIISVAAVTRFAGPSGSPAWWEFALVALAFKGTLQSLTVGQPLFLCLALGFTALVLASKGRSIPAGLALGLASFKIQVALPFGFLFLARQRWTSLATAALVVALLLVPFLLLPDDLGQALEDLPQAYNPYARAQVGQQPAPEGVVRYVQRTGTEFRVLLQRAGWAAPRSLSLIVLVGLSAILLLIDNRRRLDDRMLFTGLAVVNLLFTPHLYYDGLILLPAVALASFAKPTIRKLLFVATLTFWIPVNGIARALGWNDGMDPLLLSMPLMVLLVGLLLLASPGLAAHEEVQ